MSKIECPNCHETFNIDEASYAEIQRQVRTETLEAELKQRLAAIEKQAATERKLAEEQLKAQLEADFHARMESLNQQNQAGIEALKAKLAEQEKQAAELEAKLKSADTEKSLAIVQQVGAIEKERDQLKADLKLAEVQASQQIEALKNAQAEALKSKDILLQHKEEEVERLKDMKARLSTKMLGETLEQHCEIEFEKLRSLFGNVEFGKDTGAGTKGDYIYREHDEDGNELISIMFEMKNQQDGGGAKKRNTDFLDKLDKDRSNRECEYAVLVSLLEPENEFYNVGIADMSHIHPKTYVVRPQFFIPIISLLRNAAKNAMHYKAELARVKNRNIDITNFENQLEEFKQSFGRNFDLAGRQFNDAIGQIDKSIEALNRTKDFLLKSHNNLRLANNKSQALTIGTLAKDSPSLKPED